MRTPASAGLSALRIIEDEAARGRGDRITLRAGRDAAVYVLNKKRAELADIEHRYGVSVEIIIDESFEGARMTVDSSGGKPVAAPRIERPPVEVEDEEETIEISLEGEEQEEEEEDEEREQIGEGERQPRRRRRRRRGGRGRRREGAEAPIGGSTETAGEPEQAELVADAGGPAEQAQESEAEQPKRRRRRRSKPASEMPGPEVEPDSSPMVERPIDEEPPITPTESEASEKPKRRRSRKAVSAESSSEPAAPASAEAAPADMAEASPKRRAKPVKVVEPSDGAPVPEPVPAANNDAESGGQSAQRRGWWQRTIANRL